MVDSTKGHNGYYVDMPGERFLQLLLRQHYVPTLQNEPQPTTSSWLDGTYVVSFKVGDLCRVKKKNSCKFYRLADIRDGHYEWVDASQADLSDYYTRKEIDDKLSKLVIPGGGSGVNIMTQEEYDTLLAGDAISANSVYFIVERDEAQALYIGTILIAKKGEIGDVGFPYTFPIIF